MRIRGVLVSTVVAVVALMLTACGGMSGPANQRPSDDAPRPAALRTELDAQMQDPCFREPTEMAPSDCQKYITQLTSTPGSASKLGRDNPALRRSAQTLREGIDAYRGSSCTKVSEAREACSDALSTVADGVRAIRQALESGTG